MKHASTLIVVFGLTQGLSAATFESQLSTVTIDGEIGVAGGGRLFADSAASIVRLQLWTMHEAPSIVAEAIPLTISNEGSEQTFLLSFQNTHRLYWDAIVNPFASVDGVNPVVRDPLIGPGHWNVYEGTVDDTQGFFTHNAAVRFRRNLAGVPAESSGSLMLVPQPTPNWIMIAGLVAFSRFRGRTIACTGEREPSELAIRNFSARSQ